MLMLVGVETVCHHNGGRSMLAYHHCGDNYITPATQSLNGFEWSNSVLLDHSTVTKVYTLPSARLPRSILRRAMYHLAEQRL